MQHCRQFLSGKSHIVYKSIKEYKKKIKKDRIPFVLIRKPKLEDLVQKGVIPNKDCQWHLQTAST
jgi:hypothetical protein